MARELLLELLGEYCGFRQLPPMATYPGGKPYFPDYPQLHFSLSHCRGAVMAVVDGREVGCDVEDFCSDLSAEFLAVAFSDAERRAIRESASPCVELTRLWTRKEAVVKRSGIIPDDPSEWPSDDAGLTTAVCAGLDYVFSIAVSP